MILYWEQLSQLIRDALHYHNVARIVGGVEYYKRPTMVLNGESYTAFMEKDRKYKIKIFGILEF